MDYTRLSPDTILLSMLQIIRKTIPMLHDHYRTFNGKSFGRSRANQRLSILCGG
ncbi:hypothetical protein SESBI_11837 [Sesbania bispinosa]|nr:hypothetical protein SESBI_11837 [Sesbania bispinosa]